MPFHHTCEQCGVVFTRSSRKRRGRPLRYCSKACYDIAQTPPLADRFWSKVAVGTPDECWEWQGKRRPAGYGQFWYKGRNHDAQRVAFFLTHGYWPKLGCHSCDNPPCVNPGHVFDGTYADNTMDMMQKGRDQSRGSRNRIAKLTESDVIEIRALYSTGEWTQVRLAERFGVCFSNIGLIVNRKHWKHVA